MKPRKVGNRYENDVPDDGRFDEDRPRRNRTPKPKAGKRRKLPWLLLSVLVLIALLPTIVAKTPLRNAVISAALPTREVRVSVGMASLGWFTPPSVGQVQVCDAAGQPLLTADAIRIDRAPGSLLLEPNILGTIEIDRPVIYLKLRADGSNLQDALQKALAELAPKANQPGAAGPTAKPIAVAVRVSDGTIIAEDVSTGRRWRIMSVNLNYYNHDSPTGLGHGQLSAQIADVDSQNSVVGTPGQFAIELKLGDNKQEKMSLQASGLSLGLADAWLRQYINGSELSGSLSGQGIATWSTATVGFPQDLTTSGTLTVDRLDATAPLLAGDHVRLARVELPWRLSAQPD
jgi:hypothetical protein